MDFIQLNTYTGYSFGKSIIRPEEYCKKAAELGYLAVGFADDNIYSYPSYAKECIKNHLKPVFGYRVRLSSSETHPLDAVLYLINEEGYLNLCKLLRNRKELYGVDDFKDCHRGMVMVIDTECGDYYEPMFQNLVSPLLFKYHKIFMDDFYYGVTLNSNQDQEDVKNLYAFAMTTETKTLAFPRVNYLKKTDYYFLRLFEAAYQKSVLDPHVEQEGPNFLLSPKTLTLLYREEDLQELENLIGRITFDLFKKRGMLIHFDDDDALLKKQATEGLKNRLGSDTIPEDYQARLDYELGVIKEMKFSSYFLLVSDYCTYAKTHDIKIGPGRGSAGGSLVSYCLSITELDPIHYRLSFERFLNPKRQTMPDIDIDFEDTKRQEIIDYLKRKYGESRVCEIVTFSTLKPKSVLNLIGPCLSFNPNRLKKLTGQISASASTFEEAVNDRFFGYRFKKMLEDPYYNDLVKKASALLSLPINTSIHASGIIVNNDPIYLTSMMSKGEKGVSCFEYPFMEELGYLKVDILGLSNLSFIRAIEERVLRNGKSIPMIQSVLDDRETFRILNQLDVSYIFQLESKGMQETIQIVKPSSFYDIASLIALFRPGPKEYIPLFAKRKHQEAEIHYPVPSMEPILKETYGIMVYQEEVMEVLKAVASFSASDADLFRRAISKKKKELMVSYKEKFLQGASANGIDNEASELIYQDIEKFSSYGFNKSHAYSYALLVFQLLYYKAHYPEEFYITALNATSLSSDKFIALGSELKKRGYRISAPDINHSKVDEAVFENEAVHLPLDVIASSDRTFLQAFIEERKKGIYTSFFSFIKRNLASLSALRDYRTMDRLIQAGVFDSLFIGRDALSESLPQAIRFLSNGFDESSIPSLELGDEDLGTRLSEERYALGIILSVRFTSLFKKAGYKTLLVFDTGNMEVNSTITCISENKDYVLQISPGEKYEKNEFVFVKAEFRKYGRTVPTKIIRIGRRKVKDHVKNLYR